ncbi:MAG: diaminopimelate decarboxylase, partial [Anaeroplasmataceae bacterium]|nr:diaminopimelate decarboxylase [Anaeroplasmataceae bacterium]
MDYNFLAEKYGTPLYVYNEDQIQMNMKAYLNSFKSNMFSTEVAYASKAFCVKELLRLVSSYHMSLDVVSLGELYTAKSVDFDFSKIYFHGNNKSAEELMFAVKHNVGNIVVDNLEELKKLDLITKEFQKEVSILIRLNSGIEAHTHKYIVTGHIDSKFGVLYQSLEYEEMMKLINDSKWICFTGFHSHIGSQIFDLTAYEALIERMILICKDFSYPLVLNLGGGFGARYVASDHPVPLDEVGKMLVSKTEECLFKYQIKIAKLVIEPGRSIVAEAGSTLYRIGG